MAYEKLLEQLLEECQRKLPVTDFVVVQSERQVLLEKRIVTPTMVAALTLEQLCAFTLSPGAATALKVAFPSAGGVKVNPLAQSDELTVLWARMPSSHALFTLSC